MVSDVESQPGLGPDPRDGRSDAWLDERAQIASALFGHAPPVKYVGKYRIDRVLGEGAMGVVYEGWDDELQRPVALKIIRSDRFDDDRAEARFEREAVALAKLAHPNVVTIHEISEHEEQRFLVMELVRGRTLLAWRKAAPRTWEECLDVYVQAGRGLSAAHDAGVVHRDFKPANCIVGERGRVRVLDFGLARGLSDALEEDETTVSREKLQPLDVMLTKTGAVVGTPAYMAPEQVQANVVNAASDQFAFCVALYESLVGVRPFAGNTMFELCANVRAANFQPTQGSDSTSPPSGLIELLRRGLHNDPQRRWPDMASLVDALDQLPSQRRRRRAAWGVAGVLAAGMGIAVLWPEPVPCADLTSSDTWSAAQRDAVRDAVLAPGKSGRVAWQSLDKVATDWATQWETVRLEACQSARVSEETTETTYARQLTCLERQASTTDVLLDGLAADPLAWQHAVEVVRALPDIAPCASPRQVLRVDPPAAALVPVIEKAHARMDEALSLWTRGEADEAVRVLDAVWRDAQMLGDPRLRAVVGHKRGWLQMYAVDVSAEDTLTRALADAELAGDDLLAAEVATELVMLAAIRGDAKVGAHWRTLAQAKTERVDAGWQTHALVALHSAELASVTGDHERAKTDVDRALALHGATGTHSIGYADALSVKARVLEASGEFMRAVEAHDVAVEALERLMGPRHVLLGGARLNRGLLRFELGDERGAMTDIDAAIEVFEDVGRTSRSLVAARMARLQVLSMQGKLDLATLERAASPLTSLPENDPDRIALAQMKAAFLQRSGRENDALVEYQRVISILLREPEPAVEEIAMLRSNAAECLVTLGRWPQARTQFEAALKVLESSVAVDDPRLAYPLGGLGDVELHEKAYARAQTLFERALKLARANPGDVLNLGKVRWGLARAIEGAQAGTDRARELAQEAKRDFSKLEDEGREYVQAIDDWMSSHPRRERDVSRINNTQEDEQ